MASTQNSKRRGYPSAKAHSLQILRWPIFVLLALVATTAFAQETRLAEIVIMPQDVNSVVKVQFSKRYPTSLEIGLTRNKAKDVAAITKENLGRIVRVKIGATIVSAAKVVEALSGTLFHVGCKDSDEAVRLAKFLTDSK